MGGTYGAWDLATSPLVSVLPQSPSSPPGLTVRELVELGRFPHTGLFGRFGAEGKLAVESALTLTGLSGFAERPLDELSGGERQRAWIALALAQGAGTLLLEEPTTFLDVRHQFEVLDLVASLCASGDMTVVLVLHDLLHAANLRTGWWWTAAGSWRTARLPQSSPSN